MHLTSQQIADYERNGFLTGIRVVDEAQAALYQENYNELEAREGRQKCQTGLLDRHFDERFIWDIATNSNVLDVVESLIGPDILLLATHFFCKYGPSEKFVAWHQDVTYWGLDPALSITAWYAIDDSDAGNGCMRAIPGSHLHDIAEHGKSGTGDNLLSIDQTLVVGAEDEARAVDMISRAGEISLHDGKVIHGSLPNRSERRRCGLTLRYIPPHVRQVNAHSGDGVYKPVLVRGTDGHGNFPHRPQPFAMAEA